MSADDFLEPQVRPEPKPEEETLEDDLPSDRSSSEHPAESDETGLAGDEQLGLTPPD